MFNRTAKELAQPELLIQHEKLEEKYRQLKLKYIKRSEKYNSLLKSKHLLSKQIQRWSRRYQRLKITIAASTIETASFEVYAASVESNGDEIKQLEALVHHLNLQNTELEQELEQSKRYNQTPQRNSKKSANSQELPQTAVVIDFASQVDKKSQHQAIANES